MSANCIFCKIIKSEIPAKKVFENEQVLAFIDMYPQAKNHLLFIHKNHTANINEMCSDPESIGKVFLAIEEYTKKEKLDSMGFRIVTNLGPDAGQTVFHTHFHVLSGEKLGHFGS